MTSTSSVLILCGIQFTGKTTLARALAMLRGWAHVSSDEIVESLLESVDGEISEEQWSEAFHISLKRVAESLARGQSVVYDSTAFERVTRDQIRAIARQYDASARVVYFTLPVAEANRRRIENQLHPQRHDVSEKGFWELVNSLEPPTADESILIFDGTLDAATWIERFVHN
jgi:predicted kinase